MKNEIIKDNEKFNSENNLTKSNIASDNDDFFSDISEETFKVWEVIRKL